VWEVAFLHLVAAGVVPRTNTPTAAHIQHSRLTFGCGIEALQVYQSLQGVVFAEPKKDSVLRIAAGSSGDTNSHNENTIRMISP